MGKQSHNLYPVYEIRTSSRVIRHTSHRTQVSGLDTNVPTKIMFFLNGMNNLSAN